MRTPRRCGPPKRNPGPGSPAEPGSASACLSAGEAQRLALARALAAAGGLLIVDEPTSSQDESNARDIAALLVAAAHQEGQTVICASHDPAVIGQADHVITLDA